MSRLVLSPVALLLCLLLSLSTASAEPIDAADIRVIDGDTIHAHGHPYRLVDFDAPETGRRSQCDAERAHGRKATERLRELIAGGSLDLTQVACSCKRGTGAKQCNYGRLCGTLKAEGRDVGAILIEEGLARPYHCTKGRCPPIGGYWCAAPH